MSLNPSVIDSNTSILNVPNVSKYNGRVDIIQEPPANIRFQMQEKIAIKNKATAYREALTGTWENNTLSQLFFSAENIQILQNGIRAGVYKMSNGQINVPPQNIDSLKIIMRGTYLQYAEHYENGITQQIERLNTIVLDYCVKSVYGEAIGYLKYCQDQSSLVVPFDRPIPTDREYKQLELRPFF
uniref:Minor capsid protein P8 central region domain-containing protein n=1 Tax=viral metagenome TaxID=1070528 RepID=A0A6C0HJ19_9ZZZZ